MIDIDQSVEIDDTLGSFIDLSRFYRFHRFTPEDISILLFLQNWKLISCKQWICWQFCVFTVMPSKIKIQTSQYRKSRIWEMKEDKYTGCPKSSFLYFISLYFSTIGLGKQIISTKVVSFNIIHYFHTCCAIFWLEYSICVLPRQRCTCASIFSSLFLFVFYSPNCSNSFLVFCEYQER